MNLSPKPQASIAEQRARRFVVEQFLEILTHNAGDPARIGRRVLVLDHLLKQRDGTAPKSKVLARRLKVSETRISVALSAARRALDDLLKS